MATQTPTRPRTLSFSLPPTPPLSPSSSPEATTTLPLPPPSVLARHTPPPSPHLLRPLPRMNSSPFEGATTPTWDSDEATATSGEPGGGETTVNHVEVDDDDDLVLSIDMGVRKIRACLMNMRLEVVHVEQVDIDLEAPEYGTRNGVFTVGTEVTCPSELRIKALDLVLEKLARETDELGLLKRVRCIGGAAQNTAHYLLPTFISLLTTLPSLSSSRLSTLLTSPSSIFSLSDPATSADTSTTNQVRSMLDQLGEEGANGRGLGSLAARVMKVRMEERMEMMGGKEVIEDGLEGEVDGVRRPGVLESTERICLEGNLISSLLCGSPTPIDPSDASTTGLFDVDTADWDHEVLSCVMGEVEGSGSGAEELKELLGPVGWNVGEPLGNISSYFVERFGFRSDCLIAPFTSTISASFLAHNLAPRDALLSLSVNDSDVLIVPCEGSGLSYDPRDKWETVINPVWNGEEEDTAGKWFGMLVNKEAAIGRALVRDLHSNGDWHVLSRLTAIVPHGGTIGLDDKHHIFFKTQHDMLSPLMPTLTTPSTIRSSSAQNVVTQGLVRFVGGLRVPEFIDRKLNPRLLLESQFLSLRLSLATYYSPPTTAIFSSPVQRITSNEKPSRLILTGGGAQNPAMVSLASTVFGVETFFLPLGCSSSSSITPSPTTTTSEVDSRATMDGMIEEEERKEEGKMSTTSSAVGAGRKAAWIWARATLGEEKGFREWVEEVLEKQREEGGGDGDGLELAATPDLDEHQYYTSMIPEHVRLDALLMRGFV